MPQQLQRSPRVASRFQSWRTTSNEIRPAPSASFHWPSVALAALAAAAAITIYMMSIPRLLGVEAMDIGITIGAMADPAGGLGAWLVRIAWHVGHGLAYVPVYAAILLWFRVESSARTGVAFGVFLWLAGPMLLIPILLNRPWLGSGEATHPGIFMLALGLGWKPAVIDLGAHLIHGTIAGVICKHRRNHRLEAADDEGPVQTAARVVETQELARRLG